MTMWKPEIETEEKGRRLELLDLFQLHSVMKKNNFFVQFSTFCH